MGETQIMEHKQEKVRSKLRISFSPQRSEETGILEQQGTVNNRTFVLLNFRSITVATLKYIYILCVYIETFLCIYVYACKNSLYIYIYMRYVCVYLFISTCIYTYVNMYAYIYVCVCM